MLRDLAGVGDDADLSDIDFERSARQYLVKGGLTDSQIDGIVAYLCD